MFLYSNYFFPNVPENATEIPEVACDVNAGKHCHYFLSETMASQANISDISILERNYSSSNEDYGSLESSSVKKLSTVDMGAGVKPYQFEAVSKCQMMAKMPTNKEKVTTYI